MDLFTYLMNKNGNNAPGDLFSSLLGKGQNGTYQTFTGTSINANNTKKGKMKLSLYGNTEQDTTTGKNIIRYPYDATSGKYANVNVTINNDGSVTLNGTGNNTGYINLVSYDNKMHLVAGTYTLSKNVGVECSINDGTNTLAYISRTQTSATFTITEAKDIQLFFAVRSEIAYNVTVYPMLEIGSSATEWEKPTNGASPNPSYPQPIHTISVDNEVVISGSQLFDASKHIVLSSNGITATINNGEIILNGTATATAYIGFHLNNTIPSGTIVSYGANNSSTMAQCYLNLVLDNATKEVVQMNTQNCKRENITLSSDINGVYIQIGNGITLNNFKIKPMLNIGATLREYEPYQSNSVLLTLGDKEICKIGNYEDKIFKAIKGNEIYDSLSVEEKNTLDYGKWYLRKNIGKVVLDGSESYTNATAYYYILLSEITPIPRPSSSLLSNYFVNTQENGNGGIWAGTGALAFNKNGLPNTITDLASFKAWLGNNNTIVYYQMVTPTNELFNDAQQEQLEDIYNNMLSYEGQTNINQTNNDLSANMEAQILVNE